MNIPIEWKQEYLNWILNKKISDKLLICHIIKFINNNKTILNNLHFVNKAKYANRSLVLHEINNDYQISLYLENYRISKPSLIYQNLNTYMEDDLYIEIDFKCPKKYAKVYENNPFLSYEEMYSQENRDFVDNFISLYSLNFREKEIKDLLYNSLKNDDKKLFEKLVPKYREIQISKQYYIEEISEEF